MLQNYVIEHVYIFYVYLRWDLHFQNGNGSTHIYIQQLKPYYQNDYDQCVNVLSIYWYPITTVL
jgi:hypothetical protein